MAKIFKISGYFIDPNGDDDAEGLQAFIESKVDLITHHFKVEEQNIGEWEDENPLNYCNCPISECEKYFANHKQDAGKAD